jgi:hypothetical protein
MNIIIFVHLLSTNHKCTHPCYLPLLLKICCSEDGDGVEFFDEEFQSCAAQLHIHADYGASAIFAIVRVV